MALPITRSDLSAGELRVAARRSKDTHQARRQLALALVLEGRSRREAARSAVMDRQTLRDRVIRYNLKGVEGLCDRARPGRLTATQRAELEHLEQIVTNPGRIAARLGCGPL